jgi:hypothetical protein
LHGTVNLIGEAGRAQGVAAGTALLEQRSARPDLAPDPGLPPETRLWAALQDASGGTWGGCVFDVDAIVARLRS